jgi:hypothetical protein
VHAVSCCAWSTDADSLAARLKGLRRAESATVAPSSEGGQLRWSRGSGIVPGHAVRTLEPSHRALAVAHYGEARVVELETVDSQAILRTGLKLQDQQSRERFGHDFLWLAATVQTDLVREISRTPPDSPLGRCYLFLRREAIRGYFTSQAGLIELDYKGNATYGVCPGCESRRG